jgi:hypothetical protein
MSENFENELRRALRPLDAPAGFTDRVMRALPATREPVPMEERVEAPRRWTQRLGVPVAFAATIVAAVVLGMHVQKVKTERIAAEEQAAGIAASRELMQALHVTSQKLDLAYQASKAPSPAPAGEENRT